MMTSDKIDKQVSKRDANGSLCTGRLYEPKTLGIHMTDLCNSRCIFCGENSPSHQVDSIKYLRIVEFLSEHANDDWTAVNLHGGEPTIKKEFLSVLERIREFGFSKIILQTNAIRFGSSQFLNKVDKIGLDVVTVGFHAHNAELMDDVVQISDAYNKIVNGIKNIRKLDTILRATIVVCSKNGKYLEDICKLAIDLGVDHINISAMQPGGAAESISTELLVEYSSVYASLAKSIMLALDQNLTVTLEGFPICAVPGYEGIHVNWNLHTLKVLYGELVLDNFNDFLNQTIRKKHQKCKNCKYAQVCCGVYRGYLDAYGWSGFSPYHY